VAVRGGEGDDRFVSRGAGVVDAAQLRVYRLHEGGAAERVEGVVHAGDELAFAYSNPDARRQLMVFAVDEAGKVYWYVPAWTDAAADPHSLAIAPGADFHEVHDAVTHELTGHHLLVHALFTDETFTVRQIETLLQLEPAALARLGRPHLQVALEVVP
jgi:hypothetical protein